MSTSDATPLGTRKNGKIPSCEPCRLAKVRCDHGRPTCLRCQRRRRSCYYHPAPMTKTADGNHGRDPSPTDTPQRLQTIDHPLAETIRGLLQHTKHLPRMLDLVKGYFSTATPTYCSKIFVLSAITYLHDRWKAAASQQHFITTLTAEIIASMSEKVMIGPNTGPAEFCRQHQTRLETIGQLYSLSVRSSRYKLIHNISQTDDWTDEVYKASYKILQIGNEHSTDVTHAQVWQGYDHLILTTVIEGDSSPLVARVIDRVMSNAIDLGLHREAENLKQAPWLGEVRRRTFLRLFCTDKYLAKLIKRPPRLHRHFFDTKMPLDVDEEKLTSTDPSMWHTLVDDEGWNLKRELVPIGRARVGFLTAMLREEVDEYDYRPLTMASVTSLLALSMRTNEIWEAIPACLRYTGACWDNAEIHTCIGLVTVFLGYLVIDMEILSMAASVDSSLTVSVLQVCERIVTALLQLASNRTRAIFVNYEFAYLALAYGIEPAIRLAQALRGPLPIDWTTIADSRMKVVRQLSVFVDSLETIRGVSDRDLRISHEAAQLISGLLDETLAGPQVTPQASTAAISAHGNIVGSALQGQDNEQELSFLMHDLHPHTTMWIDDFEWMSSGSGLIGLNGT